MDEQYANLLVRALIENDAGAVSDLIRSGMSPDILTHERTSALYSATVKDDYATMMVLLDGGANPNFPGTDQKVISEYGSPLNFACSHGRRSAATLLLSRGANPQICNSAGRDAGQCMLSYGMFKEKATPLWLKFAETTLEQMFDAGLAATPQLLESALSGRANLSTISLALDRSATTHDKHGLAEDMLHHAAGLSRADALELLVARGAGIDAPDLDGRTPLFAAPDPETMSVILGLGANINHQDARGDTILHTKIRSETSRARVSQVVQQLLAAGAAVDLRNNDGVTALDLARERSLNAHIALLSATAARRTMSTVSMRAAEPT